MTTSIIIIIIILISFAAFVIALYTLPKHPDLWAKEPPLYAVHWQLLSGEQGYGEPLPKEVAEERAASLAWEFVEDFYWVEKVGQTLPTGQHGRS